MELLSRQARSSTFDNFRQFDFTEPACSLFDSMFRTRHFWRARLMVILICSIFWFHGIGLHVKPLFYLRHYIDHTEQGCTSCLKILPLSGHVKLFSILKGTFFLFICLAVWEHGLALWFTVWHFDFTEPALRRSSSSLFEVSFRVCGFKVYIGIFVSRVSF